MRRSVFVYAMLVAPLFLAEARAQTEGSTRTSLPRGAALNAKEQSTVDGVSTAWLRGDPWTAMQLLSPLVGKLNREKLAEVERILQERAIVPIGQILAQARLAIVQQGQAENLPKPQVPEALLVLPQLADAVNKILELRDKNPVMADPLPMPGTIQEYEDLLWGTHVLKNRLLNARSIAEHAARMKKTLPRAQLEKLSEEQRAIIDRDFESLVAGIDRSLEELEEREIELRIWRLKLARELLAKPELTADKFMAAHASRLDARLIQEFFAARKNRKSAFLRVDLNVEELPKWVAADAEESRRLAGNLQPKAEAFFDALHWWYRGRYGQGTHVFGLAKSPAANTSPAAMFGLLMPATPPKPTDPVKPQQSPPLFDRRHHYWWAWEDRRVLRSTDEEAQTTTEVAFNGTRYDAMVFW